MKRNWFIGIDISKKTLDVVIYDQEKKNASKHFKVNNELKGFKEMIKTLKAEGVVLKEAFICLEYCGNPKSAEFTIFLGYLHLFDRGWKITA